MATNSNTGISGDTNGSDGTAEAENAVLRLLLKSSKAITSEVELEKLVQRVTDIGTEVTGAAFGALFYKVENHAGENYFLYTISGAPKEAFSKFPTPRNTEIFNPTFAGRGVVRYDDVTKEPHYGQNTPYNGMPKGHLPVRSYLAAPVISSLTNEVIGGLFFGHPEPGVFKAESETLIEGIAAQAAIAMANARLFEEKKKTERKLRERSDQYKSIFESTFDAILIFTMEGAIVEANKAAQRLFALGELSKSENSGSLIFDNDRFLDSVKEMVKAGRKYSGEGWIKSLGGRKLYAEINVSSFAYADKQHMLAVFSPLSSQKAVEAIDEISGFSDVINGAAPVALWMTNKQGSMIYFNQTWIDWTGKPLEDHLGMNWLAHILAEDRDRTEDAFQQAFANHSVFEMEYRLQRADGMIIWCLANGNPWYSHNGVFQGMVGSVMDITERKEIEEKLYSQNVLINTITNNTLQALFMMDHRQFCTYMNPAAEQMTGYKLSEVRDKPLHYYIHHTHPDGRHFPIEECPIDRALPERMQTQGEDVFIHRKGHFYSVAFTASPIIENDIPKGTVIEVRDTTEEKNLEAALKKKEAADKVLLEQKVLERTAELEKINYELLQFTSVASHDLKEPLRKISVFSKMLLDRGKEQLDETLHRYLAQIIQASGRMTTLIDDLLFFSRLSQENTKFSDVDLSSLIGDILSNLEIAIQEKQAELHVSDLPTVRGIPFQLGQVFQNLISNSLKFTHPDRQPVIRILAGRIEKNGRLYHHIIYTDNGIGFDNKYAGKIFEIFQRLHTKEKYEGTGVGLAIVKKIVSLHNGEVMASGVPDQGATFEILLPV